MQFSIVACRSSADVASLLFVDCEPNSEQPSARYFYDDSADGDDGSTTQTLDCGNYGTSGRLSNVAQAL